MAIRTRNKSLKFLELALPFYGKIPDRQCWIKVSGSRTDVITITVNSDGADIYKWYSAQEAGIEEFVPCTEQDWQQAKLAVVRQIAEEGGQS